MTEHKPEKPSYKAPSYQPSEMESPSSPDMDYESPSMPDPQKTQYVSPKVSFGYTSSHTEVHKSMKKHKKKYDPGYMMKPKHHHHHHHCAPMTCQPCYVIRDCYHPREVPIVHPIVNVTRHHIVNVPRHYYQYSTQDVTVDPYDPKKGYKGYPPNYQG